MANRDNPAMVKYSPEHRLKVIELMCEKSFDRARELFDDDRPSELADKNLRQQFAAELRFRTQAVWNLACCEDEWIDRYDELIAHDGKITTEQIHDPNH